MDGGDIASTIIGALGLLGGVIGYLTARGARKRADSAEAASKLAQARSTKAAEDAAAALRRANEIAQESSSREEEDWFVEWRVKWDRTSGELTLVNRGRDTARQPTAVITARSIHHVHRQDTDVPVGEPMVIALPEIDEQRAAKKVRDRETARAMEGTMVIWVPNSFSVKLRIVVRWKTGLGLPQEQVIEKSVA